MMQEKNDNSLEKTLLSLDTDLRYKTLLNIVTTSLDHREQARVASAWIPQISEKMWLEVLVHYKGKENEVNVLETLVERVAVKHNFRQIMQSGAHRFMALANANIIMDIRAANLFDKAGYSRNAAACYERAEMWEQAAESYKHWNDQKAAECFEKAGKIKEAARCASKYDTQKAISLALSINDKENATLYAADAGLYEQALQLAENNIELKIEVAARCGKIEDEYRFCIQTGHKVKAADLLWNYDNRDAKLNDEMIVLYRELCGIALNQQDFHNALYYAHRTNDLKEVANVQAQQGHLFEAAQIYHKAGDSQKATELIQQDLAKALTNIDFAHAARCSSQLGAWTKDEDLLARARTYMILADGTQKL